MKRRFYLVMVIFLTISILGCEEVKNNTEDSSLMDAKFSMRDLKSREKDIVEANNQFAWKLFSEVLSHNEGEDLKAIVQQGLPGRNFALSQSWSAAHLTRPEWRGRDIMGYSIRTDRYRYTEWGGGEYGTELYDYHEDPAEFSNLALEPGYEEVIGKMKTLLNDKLRLIHQKGN